MKARARRTTGAYDCALVLKWMVSYVTISDKLWWNRKDGVLVYCSRAWPNLSELLSTNRPQQFSRHLPRFA